MEGLIICLILASVSIGSCIGQYVPVYGFEGAASALHSGKTLHYYIRLDECIQRTGRGYPEYGEPFGSHVTKWRTFSDHERAEIPYLIFHEQIPVLNRAGRLEQLSRDVRVMANGTVTVTSAAYTPDFSSSSYMYSHDCTMSTAGTVGNIDFKARSSEPVALNSFDAITEALVEGDYLHFNAMTFLCPGGVEHSFSGLGGHISNYEFVYNSLGEVGNIKFFVQTTVHYDFLNNYATNIDVTLDNRTATIVDNKSSLPNFITMDVHTSRCVLEVGQRGGMFTVYKSV